MVTEPRNHRRWLETAVIFAAWTVFGLLLANQNYIQSELRGRPMSWAFVMRRALLDAYLWAFATLAIFWLARRFPLERGRLARSIPVIVVGALLAVGVPLTAEGTGLARIFGFIALVLAGINIFGGFLVTERMLAMYKKKG